MSAPTLSRTREVTYLLNAWSGGDRQALDRLLPHVYSELRRLARRALSAEKRGHTLDSVALVHEAYLKLVDRGDVHWENRAHFFAIAARAMRTLLIDHARHRCAAKRGGGAVAVPLDVVADLLPVEQADHLIALDDALSRLGQIDDTACRVVECRYFAGLTLEEIAAVLGLSPATVRRRWSFAKAWLHRELNDQT
jgi:RNA polymerase sigma-70 factor, ECF subfamily